MRSSGNGFRSMRVFSRMNEKLLLICLIIVCCFVFLVPSCTEDNSNSTEPPEPLPLSSKRILFIGNSYTDFNRGVDRHLRGLVPSIETWRIAPGGYTLEHHWNDDDTLNTIREGGWDFVILQEQSQMPVFDQATFYEFARKFEREITNVGAETMFFMTWERPDSVPSGVTTESLANAYTSIGTELGAKVAPVGIAFARALQERPNLILNSYDGHPTIHGTYLAACVFYASIFEQSPVGNTYSDAMITEEERTFLQRIAAETLGI